MYSSVRIDKDCRWLLSTYWRGMLLFFVAILFDAISTTHAMRCYGTASELHPLVRLYSELSGESWPACWSMFQSRGGNSGSSLFYKICTAYLWYCYNRSFSGGLL